MHRAEEKLFGERHTRGRGEKPATMKRGETMEGLVSEEDKEAEEGSIIVGYNRLCTVSRKHEYVIYIN